MDLTSASDIGCRIPTADVTPTIKHAGMLAYKRYPGELVVVSFPQPTPPWSINEERAHHWTWRHKRASAWREATGQVFQWARCPVLEGRWQFEAKLIFGRNTRRDPANFMGAMKAALDAIVTDLSLLPDDTAEFVEVREPFLIVANPATTPTQLRLTRID